MFATKNSKPSNEETFEAYPTNVFFFANKYIFAVKKGHFLVNAFLSICCKHSSLTTKIGKGGKQTLVG